MSVRSRHELTWTVGHAPSREAEPSRFVPATVPGAVQLDWARAEGWPPHWKAEHFRDYRWMEDACWRYRAVLPALDRGNRELWFVSRGVDYRCEIRLDGRLLHEQEGMFAPIELPLGAEARAGAVLEVLVFPAPTNPANPDVLKGYNQSCKPGVAYGWDFHPRLIPLGIWDETVLELRPSPHLRRAEVRYRLDESCTRAAVRCEVELSAPSDGALRWTLTDPQGQLAARHETRGPAAALELAAALERPALWWPNGQGEPALYRSRLELLDRAGAVVDVAESRVGFRRVRLVPYAGSWEAECRDFPKGRNRPPITLEINGRAIFGKGGNWVPPDIFPGTIDADTYRELLEPARDAHFNLLRCWGGGMVNKEAFFDQCDELGLLVWQEFPLACSRYESTPEYLRVLDRESRAIIRRLRPHAALALWCGGNELFNAWSRMTDQDLALRLLNRNCYDLDPDRPFLPTSPVFGMGHGNYLFREPSGRECFQIFQQAECTAYTEFGCSAAAGLETLRAIIPEGDLFPPRRGTAWESHHAFGAWDVDPESWLMTHLVTDYFGAPQTLEELVANSQLLQATGYQLMYEEARRQKPRCAMALNWCYNEPWPTAAGNSVMQWPAKPKPCYATIRAALRPTLASARIPKFRWQAGEELVIALTLLNDDPAPTPAARVEASLRFLRGGSPVGEPLALTTWDAPAAAAGTNVAGPEARATLPRREADRIELSLRVPGRPQWDSRYTLVYRTAR
jgi:beta-mannosidase